jgi:hypothetical protein
MTSTAVRSTTTCSLASKYEYLADYARTVYVIYICDSLLLEREPGTSTQYPVPTRGPDVLELVAVSELAQAATSIE